MREHLRDALKARNYEVFLDEYDLSPGDMWRPRIYRGLTQCEGAILLLSPEGLASKWVQTEATILSCRRDLHEHFKSTFRLVPVLLSGVSRDDLRSNPRPGNLPFDHLRLADSQATNFALTDESVPAADVANEIAGHFPEVRTGTDPMMMWIKRVVGWLEKVADVAIDTAAETLQIPDADLLTDDRRQMLATALLLHQDFDVVLDALWTLLDLGGRPEKGLFDKIVPVSLPYESASRIIEALRCPNEYRVIAVNAEEPVTARRLVERATCCDRNFSIVEVPASQNPRDAYNEILRGLAQKYGDLEAWRNPEKLMRGIGGDFSKQHQIVVLLKRGGQTGLRGSVLSELLGRLRKEFGSVLFVVATGASDVAAADLGLTKLLHLDPPLPANHEERVNLAINRLEYRYFAETLGKSA